MTPDIWPAPTAEDPSSLPLESLLTREYETNPARVHERLRAAYGPVAPIELHGVPVWFAFGYDEVRYIMQNPDELWSKHVGNWRAFAEGRIPADWPLIPLLSADNSGFHDGDRHRRLRGAWIAGLLEFQEPGGEHTQKLERAIMRHCDDLIGVMTEGMPTGWADLAAQYGRPLPFMVANHLLGVTLERGEEMITDQWRLLDGPDAAGAYQRLNAALLELATLKRHQPGHDLPSAMFAADPALTPEEVARELFMLSGFLDFTGSLICNVLLEAVGNQDLRTSVSSGQIEELVNRVALLNPALANLTFRYARASVKLGRFTIAAGDPVMLSISGAHADPLFASALNRNTVRSTRAHLAWGAGPHRCPSQRLATQMCTIAVRRLLDRFSVLTPAIPPHQLPWRPSPFIRALRSLPVRFEVNPNAVPVSRPGPATAAQEPPPEETNAGGWRPSSRSGFWTFLRKLRRGQ